ncbi:MAG: hypothetical protein ABL891_04340 [Burkholderiales bacterium]
MANTVFFAWQLDTPSDQNKTFIWNALERATSTAEASASLESSPRPESDTSGVAGTPNIVETIFRRIRDCAIFVADLTFTANSESGKLSPNPNVLIELGYAARSVGWERTILVINEKYGKANHLPFDILQHRWPIEYRMSEGTTVGEKRFDQLSDALAAAIASCQQYTLERAEEMANSLDTATIDVVAQYEQADFIDMRLPAKTTGELLTGLDHILAIRQLISLGALRITHSPTVGYAWTFDGQCMIEALKRKQPRLLDVVRNHRQP